jgi:hypothetical protein
MALKYLNIQYCPKFGDKNKSEKFSADMEFHKIDPRPRLTEVIIFKCLSWILTWIRVARCDIFIPKIPICVCFTGPWKEKCCCILRSCGIF